MVNIIKSYIFKYERLLKFMIVGGSGALLSLTILYVLTNLVGLHYLVSYMFAFIIVVCSNYLLNTFWTFKGKKNNGIGRYVLISLCSLGVRQGLLFIFTDLLGLWYMLSAVIVIAGLFIINYIVSRRFVWCELK